jgi:hypothetical protein
MLPGKIAAAAGGSYAAGIDRAGLSQGAGTGETEEKRQGPPSVFPMLDQGPGRAARLQRPPPAGKFHCAGGGLTPCECPAVAIGGYLLFITLKPCGVRHLWA